MNGVQVPVPVPFTDGVVVNDCGRIVVWFAQSSGSLNLPLEGGKWFIKLLLDAGVRVRGYWSDKDLSYIDPRIHYEGARKP